MLFICQAGNGKSKRTRRSGPLMLRGRRLPRCAPTSRLNFAFVLVAASCCLFLAMVVGCRVSLRGKQRPLVSHKRIHGELEFAAEQRTDTQGFTDGDRKSTTKVFEERLRLRTEGDVYHANLLFYKAAIGLGLTQQSLDSTDESGSTSDSLDEYDVYLKFLRMKKTPLGVHMNKSEEIIARQFLGPLRSNRESTNLTLPLKFENWPMMLQYNNSQVRQREDISTTNALFDRDNEEFKYSLTHDFSEDAHMRFEFERDNVVQKNANVSTELDEDRYTLFHDLAFGDEKQHRLDSFMSYLDQSGNFNYKNFQWEERLRLQHTSDFLTKYEVRYTNTDQTLTDIEEVLARVGFEHKLYESLITTGQVFASQSDISGGQELQQQGGSLGLSYRKKNPWGVLSSSYSVNLTNAKQRGGSALASVINEPHTATVPFVDLDRMSIDMTSIIVKDEDKVTIFTEGEDYLVSENNGRVRLRIFTSGGNVPDFTDNQTFFVDYSYFVEPKRDEETLRQNFMIRQKFRNGVTVYFMHRRQDETITSTVTEITPDEFRTNTIGAEYTKGGLFVAAEYSEEESTQIPSTTKQVEAKYTWSVSPDIDAIVRASERWIHYGEPDNRDIDIFEAAAELHARLSGQYVITVFFDFRDEEDTRFGTTEGVQWGSEVKYDYRQLSVTAGVESSVLERRETEIKNLFLYMRVKRSF